MSVMKIQRYRRPVAVGLLLPLLIALIQPSLRASPPEKGRFSNLRWQMEGEKVIITYDLISDVKDPFTIQLMLRNEKDPSYNRVPKAVSGNIGENQFPGTGKRIVWDYKKDARAGIEGDGYYFELIGEPAGGGFPWLYVAGGALLAGGVIAVVASKSSSDETAPGGEAAPSLPGPPVLP